MMITVIKTLTGYNNSNVYELMIDQENELKNIDFSCAAGSIAYTAGYKAVFQLDAHGNWISM